MAPARKCEHPLEMVEAHADTAPAAPSHWGRFCSHRPVLSLGYSAESAATPNRPLAARRLVPYAAWRPPPG
jgi:hypothetical protein